MNHVTHISFALLAAFLLYSWLSPGLDAHSLNVVLIMAAVGSIIPDIDHPKAFVSRAHWMLHGASHLLNIAVHHRGITHSLAALAAITGMVYYGLPGLGLDAALAVPFAVGYLSHLLADSLNPTGVKWLQPFSERAFRLDGKLLFFRVRITTGSLADRAVGVTLAAVFLYLYARQQGLALSLPA